eukprot:CAMPEP_0203675076 /NCGR_PEP_ID=MMETSP0090-20130426/18650_1 /ASSEMBLY_ACC=CAM_ASM_001088 /TAXON_ID=426623 /ORGANISM="Chaetoceros affinis, Strain CCMP159" /LENGTH=660 /DNA_ID=CAMNT_0050541133 /DNA_START=40 /DNA_END=2019 /DNA_ORIENTATION=-
MKLSPSAILLLTAGSLDLIRFPLHFFVQGSSSGGNVGGSIKSPSLTIHQITKLQAKTRNTKLEKHQKQEESDDTIPLGDVQELYFEQRLDHFTSHPTQHQKDDFTFSQRYFYSSRYVHANGKGNDNDKHSKHVKSNGTRNLRGHEQEIESIAATVTPTTTTPTTTFAFLCVGGEGPDLTPNVLLNSVHCTGDMIELASKLYNDSEMNVNVHMFALEHRYYGKSYPTFDDGSSSTSNANLVYLSSRQALADIANFVQFAKKEYLKEMNKNSDSDSDVKWVTFGGSYPGMLAAWSRLKYPHLIYAAVSNSAPVQVVLDFPQYNDVVAASLRNEMVGGSDECFDVVSTGHDEIASMLTVGTDTETDAAREKIANLFNVCGGAESLAVDKNVHAFLGDGVVYIPVQENDPSCDGDLCNIEKICHFLTSPSSSLSSMEKLAQMSKKLSYGSCMDINWENKISYLSSDAAREEGNRSWQWQTCTEMGFYQTCEINSPNSTHAYSCPYGKGYHTVDQDLEICERAFGIDAELVPKNVEDTLTYYGGWDMAGSRILSVNGDIDPWSALSMNKKDSKSSSHSNDNGIDPDIDMPTYWSKGASHHFWTHQVKESDGDEIQATRKMIHDWVIDVLFDQSDNNDDGSKEEATVNVREDVEVGNFDFDTSGGT